MNIIAAADANWAIGYKGGLLVRIPEDQRRFQRITTGKVLVMGRRTLESLPGGLPLKNRTNIVLTRNEELKVKGAAVFHSLDALLEECKKYDTEDIYVVGGGSIYRQFLEYCDTAYITRIDYAYQADTFFPNLDTAPDWKKTEESEEQTYFDLEYTFVKYEKV